MTCSLVHRLIQLYMVIYDKQVMDNKQGILDMANTRTIILQHFQSISANAIPGPCAFPPSHVV